MIPLHVGLVTRDRPDLRERDTRCIGPFSYDVPDFTWEYICPPKHFTIDKRDFPNVDLFFLEDSAWGIFVGKGAPAVYYSIDTTLSESHYHDRVQQSAACDLVLTDHDKPERLRSCGKPVVQFPYCVNNKVFRDYGLDKTIDIGHYANSKGSDARKAAVAIMAAAAMENHWYFRGGRVGFSSYARAFNQTVISLNVPRTTLNRPHRVLEAMACKTCLLTGSIPDVAGEKRREGNDYVTFRSNEEMLRKAKWLLDNPDMCNSIASSGYRIVRKYHTWAVRSAQLRAILNERLGL